MSNKKPRLRDFGITRDERAAYHRYDTEEPFPDETLQLFTVLAVVVTALIALFIVMALRDWDLLWVPFVVVLPGGLFFMLLVVPLGMYANQYAIDSNKEKVNSSHYSRTSRLYEDSERGYFKALQKYKNALQEAEDAKRRSSEEYWNNLSGIDFEEELATLYEKLGYSVEFTPTTGDDGIDLILELDGKKTIVQCKRHDAPVGPAVARELYGALTASKASNAILACTGGFTEGVYKFVGRKRIKLISIDEILEMAERVGVQYSNPKALDSKIGGGVENGKDLELALPSSSKPDVMLDSDQSSRAGSFLGKSWLVWVIIITMIVYKVVGNSGE